MRGFVSDSEENTMRDPEDYEAITREQWRCHVRSRTRDVKTTCLQRIWTLHLQRPYEYVTCDTCKNKDETDESD